MLDKTQRTIKTVGTIIAIAAGFIIFTNSMGALVMNFIIGLEEFPEVASEPFQPMAFMMDNFLTICLVSITAGILFLIAGLYIRKYKLWASILASIVSVLLIVGIWAMMISMVGSVEVMDEFGNMFRNSFIANAISYSAPLILLIWFLNRAKVRQYMS